ncbi:hypothetical protein NSU08_31360 [Paenibacillus sp. FSL H7-0331]|uniref:hypothetical protein n=1 Tax=Paenibacillus sp. FSL H7-0331 TaxID=1920421 RepID=UPI0030FB232F
MKEVPWFKGRQMGICPNVVVTLFHRYKQKRPVSKDWSFLSSNLFVAVTGSAVVSKHEHDSILHRF